MLNQLVEKMNRIKRKLFTVSFMSLSFYDQNKFINSIVVEDDIDRSYAQYLCQKKLKKNPISFFVKSIIALIFLFPLMIFLLLKREPERNDDEILFLGVENKLPKSIGRLPTKKMVINRKLLYSDFYVIFKIWKKHPFSILFLFNIILDLSIYKFNFLKFPYCKSFYVNQEFNYSSSILTSYCELNGVKHHNYMHGEKLFNIRDAFCRFHHFYIWDVYYEKMFKDLKVIVDSFIIELPTSLSVLENVSKSNKNLAVYFLQGIESFEELIHIQKLMEGIPNGYIKPHPNYTGNLDKVDCNLIHNDINFSDVGIVISKYSTVLFEGYLQSKVIVIDDVTNSSLIEKLKELRYVMFHKNVEYLSTYHKNQLV